MTSVRPQESLPALLLPNPARDAEADQQILKDRARLLAKPVESETSAANGLELLVFRLGEEHYALETRFVQKVIRPLEIAPVPRTAAFFLGVTNLRGEVLAVMDLGIFLGRTNGLEAEWVLVLGKERAEFGIPASFVEEVIPLAFNSIYPPGKAGKNQNLDFLQGITRDALSILDGEKILNDPRLVVEEI